ncbi:MULTISPECIES: recombinase family protein [Chloroflexus]|jgi:putative resolvase|nr:MULTISPECIES: recombinase family protein [Chloroflexus]GIV94081.1 MAG: resolvase [Chloroflexus sp.]
MKRSVWAKQQGLTYKTAWRLWNEGKLPVPAEQLPNGTIIYYPPNAAQSGGAALDPRVASAEHAQDLGRQFARLVECAVQRTQTIVEVVKDIGYCRNGHRAGLIWLLCHSTAQTIVVEHRDRLTRFGFADIEAAMTAQGRSIVVI